MSEFDKVIEKLMENPENRYSLVARLSGGFLIYDHKEMGLFRCAETEDIATEEVFFYKGFALIKTGKL